MSNAAAAVADVAPAPKGKKKLIIIVAAAVLLLGGGGGAAMVLLKKKPVDADDEEAAQVEVSAHKAKGSGPKHDLKHPPAFAPLDPFTVNLADRDTERYAQVALTLELDDPKTAETVKAFMPAIRNNILMVLAHKTSAEVLASEGKVKLAGEIQRATSRALGVDVVEPGDDTDAVDDDAATSKKKKRKRKVEPALPVVAVHFSNFIVQ
ncbi:MAG: flagellar basal body-associated FliL family protein [Rubrivivax sp.]|nr:flagellar basal body-associated FliL family protein [Rubrivivax sp.]